MCMCLCVCASVCVCICLCLYLQVCVCVCLFPNFHVYLPLLFHLCFVSSCSMDSLDLTEDGSSDNLVGDGPLENSLAAADSSSMTGSLDLSKGDNQKGMLFDIGEEGHEDKVGGSEIGEYEHR